MFHWPKCKCESQPQWPHFITIHFVCVPTPVGTRAAAATVWTLMDSSSVFPAPQYVWPLALSNKERKKVITANKQGEQKKKAGEISSRVTVLVATQADKRLNWVN